jgi:mercuric ion transport protein
MPPVRFAPEEWGADMLQFFASGGAVAALAASTCCVMPLALGTLGLGSTFASSLGVLAPYQTTFRLAAIALLGAGFWLAYARRAVVVDGAACTPGRTARGAKPLLWTGASVLAVVLSEPVWGRWLT